MPNLKHMSSPIDVCMTAHVLKVRHMLRCLAVSGPRKGLEFRAAHITLTIASNMILAVVNHFLCNFSQDYRTRRVIKSSPLLSQSHHMIPFVNLPWALFCVQMMSIIAYIQLVLSCMQSGSPHPLKVPQNS